MTKEAERDLRIGKIYTPKLILKTLTETLKHKGCRFRCTVDGKGTYFPDLDDANNLAVIVEAEKINTSYSRFRNTGEQWEAVPSQTTFREYAYGPTCKAAVLALLDPGEDGER